MPRNNIIKMKWVKREEGETRSSSQVRKDVLFLFWREKRLSLTFGLVELCFKFLLCILLSDVLFIKESSNLASLLALGEKGKWRKYFSEEV